MSHSDALWRGRGLGLGGKEEGWGWEGGWGGVGGVRVYLFAATHNLKSSLKCKPDHAHRHNVKETSALEYHQQKQKFVNNESYAIYSHYCQLIWVCGGARNVMNEKSSIHNGFQIFC